MEINLINRVIASGRNAQRAMDTLSAPERRKLESAMDVEHAYYSCALEGSRIDRKEFEALAETA